MERVHDCEGIPVERQRLIYAGKQLEQERKLFQYRILEGATLHLVLRDQSVQSANNEEPAGDPTGEPILQIIDLTSRKWTIYYFSPHVSIILVSAGQLDILFRSI